jgi:YVTN family beta-propeller protein
LWILAAARLYRVDPVDMRITARIGLPAPAAAFDISEWTGLAAVTHPASRSVSLASLADGAVFKTVRAGGTPGSIRFRSDGRALLVANISERMLTVLDVAPPEPSSSGRPSGRVMVHLPLAVRPDHMCVHPTGGQVFITGEGRDAVVVVYPYYVPEIAETVLAGSRPSEMACSFTHLFVTNPTAGDVSIINVERRRVVAVAAVGAEPGHVTITPDGEYALVLNRKSGDMAVLRIAGLQPDRRKSAALFTLIPVGSKPVSAVVMAV